LSSPVHGDLILVRHSPTVRVPGTNPADWRLAPGAMELTAALAMGLQSVRLGAPGGAGGPGPIDAVVSSHEAKAVATAKTLGLVLGVPTRTSHHLEEHHRGNLLLEGADFTRTMRRFFGRQDVLVFGSETASEAAARFTKGVDAAIASLPGKRLAVVTHGTVIALALAGPNGLDPFAFWESLRMPEAIVVRRETWGIVERLALDE